MECLAQVAGRHLRIQIRPEQIHHPLAMEAMARREG
jgi:hypothetical protein